MSKINRQWDSLGGLGVYIPGDIAERLSYVQMKLQKIHDLVESGDIDEMGVRVRAFNLGKVLVEWRTGIPEEEAILHLLESDYLYNTKYMESAKYTDIELDSLDERLQNPKDESLD